MTASAHVLFASCLVACAGAASPRATKTHAATPRVWQFSSSRQVVTQEPPALFVRVERVSDPSRALPDHVRDRATTAVEQALATSELETAWPGELPRRAELERHGSQAFIVAATVHEVAIEGAAIRCRVGLRVAPWHGVDGGERWEDRKTATATGTATVTTHAQAQGVSDCVSEAVASVVTHRIVPFLRGVTR